MSLKPEETWVLLVAIEYYKSFRPNPEDNFHLDGPLADAHRLSEWLCEKAVPPHNVTVLASPLPTNHRFVNEIRARGINCIVNDAITQDTIEQAISDYRAKSGMFILFWSGHGVMSTSDAVRRPLLSTYSNSDKQNLNVDSLQQHLRSAAYAYPKQQAFIFDICGTPFDELTQQQELPDKKFQTSPQGNCLQTLLYASSDGQAAENITQKQTGLYFSELICVLNGVHDWPPDFDEVYFSVKKRFGDLQAEGRTTQYPIRQLWKSPRGREEIDLSTGEILRESTAAKTGLFFLIGGILLFLVLAGTGTWLWRNVVKRDKLDTLVSKLLKTPREADLKAAWDSADQSTQTLASEELKARISNLNSADMDPEQQRLYIRYAISLAVHGERLELVELLNAGDGEYNPKVRYDAIARVAGANLPFDQLLHASDPPSAKHALIVSLGKSLGNYPDLSSAYDTLLKIFKEDDDPGVHAACYWILMNNDATKERLLQANNELRQQGNTRLLNKNPARRQWFVHPNTGLTFIYIPLGQGGGSVYRMGDRNSRPLNGVTLPARSHQVRLPRAFIMSMTEIAWDQYTKIMDAPPSPPLGLQSRTAAESIQWVQAAEFCNKLNANHDWDSYELKKEGMVLVSRRSGFLDKSAYRLPTEAEWEFCCRAYSNARYSFGDVSNDSDWGSVNGFFSKEKSQIATFAPNQFGFFDMHGGVLEWCDDTAADYPSALDDAKSVDNGKPDDSIRDRIARGGCYDTNQVLMYSSCNRISFKMHQQTSHIGFRLARTVVSFPPTD